MTEFLCCLNDHVSSAAMHEEVNLLHLKST